jgi:ABC-type Fe3+/spermidine/putrescine transport system ATPase subunit
MRTIRIMESVNILELQRVTGWDRSSAPVAEVDLRVEPGKTLVLLGPARAGKSSLLRLVAGFGNLEGGHVVFNGHDLATLPAFKRPFTLLTHQDALFPHMTVSRNVAYGLKAKKLDRRDEENIVEQALALVGLRGMGDVYPQAMSPAERQQAALARALAVEPLVLLMDDALNQLDPLSAGHIFRDLRDHQRRQGFTIVLATTDPELAMSMADRLAILHHGRLIDHDRPDVLYTSPGSALTARLTGAVNLVPGEILRSISAHASSGAADHVVRSGEQWALALRPDHLEIHLAKPQPSLPGLEGHVERVAYAPSGLTAHIRVPDLSESLIARVDGARLDADDLPVGRKVWCTWDDGAARAVPLC